MTGKSLPGTIRVLVIDDSAFNRHAISTMLESVPGIEVVGMAADGEEGLKEALTLKPDVITLDLEMPKMDGFTFLRILMSRQPTPVVVISSYSRKQNVFKALELGALDFIAKPTRYLSPELHRIKGELVEKISMVRQLQMGSFHRRLSAQHDSAAAGRLDEEKPSFALVAMGASTGGPPALQSILRMLPFQLPAAYVISQHMPENFTRAFADRLNRYTSLEVTEARGGEELSSGKVFVAPGSHHLQLVRKGASVHTEVLRAADGTKYVPSIDTMFRSAAKAMGPGVIGILLTGMGSDGRDGMKAIKEGGGFTLAESEETAVIYGMPKEAIDGGHVDKVLRLEQMAMELSRLIEEKGRNPES